MLILWPFATAAVAINLYLLGLVGLAAGLPALAPASALWLSLPLGLPATWLAARWVGGLIASAEGWKPPATDLRGNPSSLCDEDPPQGREVTVRRDRPTGA
jgi:hypothetical protein